MKASLAATLILAASTAQAAPWSTNGVIAATWTDAKIAVGIVIDPTTQCDVAALIVMGNRDIELIGLVVDDQTFGYAEATYASEDIAVVTAEAPALRAIKTGTTAIVLTDQGSVVVPLAGSAAAINTAYGNCMTKLNEGVAEILKPLEPSAANVPAGSVNF